MYSPHRMSKTVLDSWVWLDATEGGRGDQGLVPVFEAGGTHGGC